MCVASGSCEDGSCCAGLLPCPAASSQRHTTGPTTCGGGDGANPCAGHTTSRACCDGCGWCDSCDLCMPVQASGSTVIPAPGFVCQDFDANSCDSGLGPRAARHCHTACLAAILVSLAAVFAGAATLVYRYMTKRPMCCCCGSPQRRRGRESSWGLLET